MRFLFPLLFFLVGCAHPPVSTGGYPIDPVYLCVDPPGFFSGFWHGLTLPVSLLVSLFRSDVLVYAICNRGGEYDVGFFLGFAAAMSGAKMNLNLRPAPRAQAPRDRARQPHGAPQPPRPVV